SDERGRGHPGGGPSGAGAGANGARRDRSVARRVVRADHDLRGRGAVDHPDARGADQLVPSGRSGRDHGMVDGLRPSVPGCVVDLLRNYIGSLPASVIESAKIDGADHFTIFWRLIVPLSVPALAAFAIFQFLWVWNDLLVAYVFLGGTPQNRVLTIALQQLVGARGENWELLTAAAFISMSLPLVVFLSLQRYFVRGLTAGSVKV